MQLQNVRMDAVETWMVLVDANECHQKGLQKLEITVTEQGVAIPARRTDVQGAVKNIAGVMERLATQTGGRLVTMSQAPAESRAPAPASLTKSYALCTRAAKKRMVAWRI